MAAPKTAEKTPQYEMVVDGLRFDFLTILDEFTFAEQGEYREKIRELSGDPEASIYTADAMDRLPVIVWILRKRKNENYTLDDARTLKYDDIFKPVAEEPADEADTKRPTRAPKKKGR